MAGRRGRQWGRRRTQFLILLGTAFELAAVWNADLAGLFTALGVSSIVIGLALQDTLGSVMSGIALLFVRPFTVGDWLEVGGVVGQVIDSNGRALHLLTLVFLQQSRISRKFSESQQAIPSCVPISREESSPTASSSSSGGIALQHFAAGERVIRQGQLDNELSITIAGQAVMSTRLETGGELELLFLRRGEFFGEMSLFSGEPSSVTIAASRDLEVMKISAPLVDRMIDRQPSFAHEIGQIHEIRRLAIQESKQAHQQAQQT